MADPVEPAAPIEPAPAAEPNPPLSEQPDVVENVQGKLDAFNAETPDPEPAGEPAAKPTPAAEGGEPKPAERAQPKPATAAVAPASTLPAAWRRSAQARQMTDAEIDAFWAADPMTAAKVFEGIHKSRVAEVNEWAELGRKNKAAAAPAQAPAAGAPAPSTPAPAPADPTAALKPISVTDTVKALADKYGNEELLTEVIGSLAGPLNAAIAAVQPLLAQAKQQQATAAQSQMEGLGRIIEGFFTSKEMEPFKTVYGTEKTMTPETIQARNRVLEMADALVAGAQMQGRRLSVEDALALAHDATASDIKEKIIRDQIAAAVTTRSKGLTLKPTNRGTSPLDQSRPPRDRAELMSRAQERLESVFG